MSKVKECFQSRWPGGVLMEVDFSQLEVVGVALLSEDPKLISDLLAGADMHRERAASLFGVKLSEVTKEQRQIAKVLSFQLQYGAGAKTMAEKNQVPLKLAEDFIKIYYDRYSILKNWQDKNIEKVEAGRKLSTLRTPLGEPVGVGTLDSPTGRYYTFHEYDSPEWMRKKKAYRAAKPVGFSPTQIKNYPSQGFATGDVMALFRAELLSYYRNRVLTMHTLPVMSVHDSVMFDCLNRDCADAVFSLCTDIAQKLPELLEKTWGIYCPIPFKLERKIGESWSNMA